MAVGYVVALGVGEDVAGEDPEMPYAIKPAKLAVLLQAYAESAEQVGP